MTSNNKACILNIKFFTNLTVTIVYMSVLVMAAVVVDIEDGSLTAGMSVLVMMAAAVDTHDGSVDTYQT
jgi:hypothetical protein